jgi:hypothetical protein
MLRELINTSEKTMVIVDRIKIDGGTQMRAGLDEATVSEYADFFRESRQWGDFPPVVLYHDGADYWLADGFHRVAAWQHAGNALMGAKIPAEVRSGTRRDAILHAAGANANHGLRRTNADKRRAVKVMLRDEEWAKWSDAEIARRCAVDPKTVGNLRRELLATMEIPESTHRIGADGRTIDTANIGAKPAPIIYSSDEELFAIAKKSNSTDLLANGKDRIRPPFEHDGKLWVSVGDVYAADSHQTACIRVHKPGESIAPGERYPVYREGAFTDRKVTCGTTTYYLGTQWLIIRKLIAPATPRLTATQIATTGAAEKFSITDWELSDICETVAGEFYGADALDRLITYADMDTVAATYSGGYWEKLQPVLQYYDLTDARIAVGVRTAISRMMDERGLTKFKSDDVENKRPVATQSPISQSPAYAEVWQIEHSLRGWAATQAPAELRTLARFRGGARWFEVRKLLGALTYRDRGLVQALNNLASSKERPTPAIEQTIAAAPAFVLPASTPMVDLADEHGTAEGRAQAEREAAATPAAEPTSARPDDRIECAQQLIGNYQAAIETEETYGAITGCYTEWLAPRRELQKLIDHLQRLVDLLTGQTVDAS